KFLTAAAVAIHLTSGMPCRAEELTEATILNDAGARGRNFFLGVGGEVFMDLTYSKTEWASSKKNLRVLLPVVGRMWAFYLSMVRPTMDVCFRMQHGVDRTYAWCKVDKEPNVGTVKWRGEVVSTALGELTAAAGLGFKLNVSTLRHLAEAVCHKFFRADVLEANHDAANTASNLIAMGYDPDEDEVEDLCDALDPVNRGTAVVRNGRTGGQDAFSAQSGRSLDTSWRLYARVLQHRAGMNESTMASARLASKAWQSFWSLTDITIDWGSSAPSWIKARSHGSPVDKAVQTTSPSLKKLQEVAAALTPAGPGGTPPTFTLPHEATTAHGQAETGNALRTLINDAVTTGIATALALQKGRTSGLEGSGATFEQKRMSARFPIALEDVRALETMHRVKVEQRPTKVYAGMKSHAVADTVAQMSAGRSHVVCVARTGAGKSDVFWLAAIKAQRTIGGVVLLIVPYNALIHDILASCQDYGFTAIRWEGPESFEDAILHPNIIVVSLNRAVSKPMLGWLSNPKNSDRIEAVIMDEAQVLLDERTFRTCVKRVPDLTSLLRDKPWTFLSATIPPQQEAELQRMVHLPLTFNRELTHRDNLSYSLRTYLDRKQLIAELKALIAKATGLNASLDEQVMIIVKSKHDAMTLAAALNAKAFYTSTSDENPDAVFQEGRDANMRDFLKGNLSVIIGTTGISVGINRPNIGLVVYVDAPYSVVSFAQGGGRACRNGRRGDVLIYLREDKSFAPVTTTAPSTDGEALQMLLSGTVCVRVPMGAWLDGRAATCFDLCAEPCSVCCRDRGLRLGAISPNPSTVWSAADEDEDVCRFEVVMTPDSSGAASVGRKGTLETSSAADLSTAGAVASSHGTSSFQAVKGNDEVTNEDVAGSSAGPSGYKRLGGALTNDSSKKPRSNANTITPQSRVLREKALLRAAMDAMNDGPDILDTPTKSRPSPRIHYVTGKRVAPGLRAAWALDSADEDEEPEAEFLRGNLKRMAAGETLADVLQMPPPSGVPSQGSGKGKEKAAEVQTATRAGSIKEDTGVQRDGTGGSELNRSASPWTPYTPQAGSVLHNTPAGR
ncbi:hypothetical protein A4X13_0g8660, partial [Tilletia indica]